MPRMSDRELAAVRDEYPDDDDTLAYGDAGGLLDIGPADLAGYCGGCEQTPCGCDTAPVRFIPATGGYIDHSDWAPTSGCVINPKGPA